jgi:hypothetical protein
MHVSHAGAASGGVVYEPAWPQPIPQAALQLTATHVSNVGTSICPPTGLLMTHADRQA